MNSPDAFPDATAVVTPPSGPEPHDDPDALFRRCSAAIADLTPDLIAWRRHLHRHPELSFEEHDTARYIRRLLHDFGLEVSSPNETSAMGVLRTGRPGAVVALRADIDALAVREDTGLEYASHVDGVMHACGHDGHIAAMLGVAQALQRMRESLTGEIRFIFQHGEEQVPSGALDTIESGVLEDADVVLGQHLWVPLEAGKVSVRPGPVMASTDYFDITVTGKSGHAGMPHQTIDPVAVAAQIVTNIQHLVSRTSDPLNPLVVSVTGIHTGGAPNVVPGDASVYGTIRTLDEEVRAWVVERLKDIVDGVARAHEAKSATEIRFGPPVVHNDEKVTALLADSVRRQLGEAALVSIPPVMGGDDFSYYQQRVPGAYLLVGAGTPDADNAPHHHPKFTLDESGIVNGARVLADAVVALCRPGAEPLHPEAGESP
ncbi:M20 metallopeptidase family protein [Stackebrandtia nassauensis]|uniref:Amidohydrolase n=1 Tax=Stackebrandtia nassauensis (strain DSM 44728 / CIP 108903 / NRRL B-16338 / NBRC 102104 / LLR-40K-21) TaxID=446470 RepID=D3Q4T5_STANL|nr:amidohydrolase [Stackebrandtia nassauensis]ADD42115.1 amidohydrolase [Stackebrandtia nassauensis DSM 44728]